MIDDHGKGADMDLKELLKAQYFGLVLIVEEHPLPPLAIQSGQRITNFGQYF